MGRVKEVDDAHSLSVQGSAEFHGALPLRVFPQSTHDLESPVREATQGGSIVRFRRDTFEDQDASRTRELFDMV
jgi:hypothetical protein